MSILMEIMVNDSGMSFQEKDSTVFINGRMIDTDFLFRDFVDSGMRHKDYCEIFIGNLQKNP